MQETFHIEQSRAIQIQKVRKLFPFDLNEYCITYQSKIDLNTFIMEYEYDDNIEKSRNRLYLLFKIFYRISEQLIKIYQIVNISRLNMKNILVDISNDATQRIHFINLHEKDNLISFDENLLEIILMCSEVLKIHQQQLMKKNDDISDQEYNKELNAEQENEISKEIHYATILSNEFLELLQGPMNFRDILKFFGQNKIELSFNSPLYYINEETIQNDDNY